jgi:hypothetical protein
MTADNAVGAYFLCTGIARRSAPSLVKKSKKTPPKGLEIARRRMKEVK